MEGFWLISYVALWVLVLLLSVVVLAHSRLLGLLHHRFGPTGARPLADGPAVGSRLDRLEARRLDGSPWVWEFPAAADLMLLFVSPQCQTCNELLPHVKDFARAHPEVGLALVSTMDDPAMNRAYVAFRRLEKLDYFAGARLADELNVAATPYAVYALRDGTAAGKGLVNNYEHLRGLMKSATTHAPPDPQGEPDEQPRPA